MPAAEQADADAVAAEAVGDPAHGALQQVLLRQPHPRLVPDRHQRGQPADLLALGAQRVRRAAEHRRLPLGQPEPALHPGGDQAHLVRGDLPRLLPAQRADQRLQRRLVLGADGADRLVRAHAVEQPGGGALAPVADVGAVGDVAERQHHQHVPQPPAQPPVHRQHHRDHRLGEQDVRRDDRQQHHRAAAPVEQVEADGDEDVEHHGHHRHRDQRAAQPGRDRRVAQGRQAGEGEDAPHRGEGVDPRTQPRPDAQHPLRPLGRELQRGHRGEQRGQREPDGRGQREPAVAAVEQHPGRGQRVQHEEQGRGEEPEPDEQQPRVVVPLGRAVDDQREADVHPRDERDQPEVRRVVLDEDVRDGHGEQQPQPEQAAAPDGTATPRAVPGRLSSPCHPLVRRP